MKTIFDYSAAACVRGTTSRKIVNDQKKGFCDACFSGNYPVHFEDEGHTRQLHLFEAIDQR